MERRAFLATSAALLVGVPVTRSGTEGHLAPTTMGLGDLGCEVVVRLAAQCPTMDAWAWNDRPPRAGTPRNVRVIVVDRAVLGHRRANILVSAMVAARLGSFRSDRPIRIVVGLGGEIGSGLVFPMAELLEDRTPGVEVLYSLPIGEGERRRQRWNRSLAALTAGGMTTRWVNLWEAAEPEAGLRQMCRAAHPASPIRLPPHSAGPPFARLRYLRA